METEEWLDGWGEKGSGGEASAGRQREGKQRKDVSGECLWMSLTWR